MPGCGGLRKVRIADPRRGKGKRGGIRVIYLHVPEASVVYLMISTARESRTTCRPATRKPSVPWPTTEQRADPGRRTGENHHENCESRKPLAEQIRKTGLEEAIRHARGEITLKTTTVELPDEPPEIDAPTLVALRDQSRMSQAVFARLLNVSTKTVQSWEQGVRTPSHASRAADPDLQPAPRDRLPERRPAAHHPPGGDDRAGLCRTAEDRHPGDSAVQKSRSSSASNRSARSPR